MLNTGAQGKGFGVRGKLKLRKRRTNFITKLIEKELKVYCLGMRSSRAMIRVVAVIQGKLWSPSGGVGSNRTSDTMKCSVVKRTKKTNKTSKL